MADNTILIKNALILNPTNDFKDNKQSILIKNDNNKIALELTEFIVDNKNLKFSQVVRRIGNQVCKEAEKDYNLKISILVDKYDSRMFSPKWSEHIDYAYNPGFSEVPSKNLLKEEKQS